MRLTLPCLLLLSTLAACATRPSTTQGEPATGELSGGNDLLAQRIAEAYGIDGWDQVEMIEFTFNVQSPSHNAPAARHWLWDVKNGYVQRSNDQSVITFNAANPHEEAAKAHHQFINDSYWFLFPFQLVWSDPTVTDAGMTPLPIAPADRDGQAVKVICQWPSEGGYTPGDAYDLYVGGNGRVEQWVFRRGGGEDGRAMTWEGHQQLGPIIVCTDHKNAAGDFRLWFTDVRLKVQGRDEWIEPTPIE